MSRSIQLLLQQSRSLLRPIRSHTPSTIHGYHKSLSTIPRSHSNHSNTFNPYPYLSLIPLTLLTLTLSHQNDNKLHCSSPSFNGVPLAATLLMRQTEPIFQKQFPGLEMSPVFLVNASMGWGLTNNNSDKENDKEGNKEESSTGMTIPDAHHFNFTESGGIIWSNHCEASIPIYKKLSKHEEMELGTAGLRKKPVGVLVMKGECRYGCAQVVLMEWVVRKLDGEVVWRWTKEEKE